MIDPSGSLQSVYTSEVSESDGGYVVEVPNREVELGTVESGDTVQVALFTSPAPHSESPSKKEDDSENATDQSAPSAGPPVSEGDKLEVTIESVGDQGDGVAKVDRGYVLIVPGTTPGEQPVVRVDTVKENVGFAQVIN